MQSRKVRCVQRAQGRFLWESQDDTGTAEPDHLRSGVRGTPLHPPGRVESWHGQVCALETSLRAVRTMQGVRGGWGMQTGRGSLETRSIVSKPFRHPRELGKQNHRSAQLRWQEDFHRN